MQRIFRIIFSTALGAAAALAGFAQAAAYPERPVRLIVPFAPGGASDFVGRIMQDKLGAELGQQIVIDNRTGASGYIGVEVPPIQRRMATPRCSAISARCRSMLRYFRNSG